MEFAPDAWSRFERAISVVAKSPPQHRVKPKLKKKKSPARKVSKKMTPNKYFRRVISLFDLGDLHRPIEALRGERSRSGDAIPLPPYVERSEPLEWISLYRALPVSVVSAPSPQVPYRVETQHL